MSRTNFSSDLKESHLLEKVLDNEIYPYIFRETDIDRREDLRSQYAGVDVVLSGVAVDEKAQLNYKNTPLGTQAFEVNFAARTGSGTIKQGWLFNTDLDTEVYNIIFIHRARVDKPKQPVQSADDFLALECLFVDKTQLVNSIAHKVDIAHIVDIANTMRDNGVKRERVGGLTLVHTTWLPEKPVNIVIPKNKLPLVGRAVWTEKQGVKFWMDGEKFPHRFSLNSA